MATVKGIWKFNDVLSSYTLYFRGTQPVNFYSGGLTFVQFYFTAFSASDPVSMRYGTSFTYTDSQETFPDAYIWTEVYGGPIWANDHFKTVDFGSTEQEVSDEFYEWLTANATQQANEEDATSGVTITYNGGTIATFSEDKTATLKCAGMKMKGNVVISYGVEVVNLISFTIVGTAYQAEVGMTWADWCASEYNTAGLSVDTDSTITDDGCGWVADNNYTVVESTETIIADYSYTINYSGGSNE